MKIEMLEQRIRDDKCHNSDNISQMLVKKDSSEESWLCRRCQYESW